MIGVSVRACVYVACVCVSACVEGIRSVSNAADMAYQLVWGELFQLFNHFN